MALYLEEIVVDCLNLSLARWWQIATGWKIVDEDSESMELAPAPGQKPSMMFIQVAEQKRYKNRLHMDWVPDDQQAEVERLVRLGASRIDIGQGSRPWVVMADPEGNEFCVLAAR
jgi:hypothetical protein